MTMKKMFSVGCLALLICLGGSKISAVSFDPMEYYFTIYQGKYTTDQNSVSYKYYAGTNKYDRSAYVIQNQNPINFYNFITDRNKNRMSDFCFSNAYKRENFKNYAPKDTGYGSYMYASRQNWWDGSYKITGNWAADDRTK